MRHNVILALSLALLAGCGSLPANQISLSPDHSAVTAQSNKGIYTEVPATGTRAKSIANACREHLKGWRSSLERIEFIAAHPAASGRTDYLIACVVKGTSTFRTTLVLTVDPQFKVIAAKDQVDIKQYTLQAAPFKSTEPSELKNLRSQLADQIKEMGKGQLIAIEKAKVLEDGSQNAYRLYVEISKMIPGNPDWRYHVNMEARMEKNGSLSELIELPLVGELPIF
ncbi:MAG TPA: hypothetical protein DD435_00850 [Cyanobacteria bacterium UBA8530]|nr:hypothetical protein [Cyanobacteria bacterium UBA8530]